ncbi:MAG: hypothetical protein HC933_15160 [Pleurocapsa sp. SU_196_0]|nr:hypothetical protein [Pleurocapsa sp. SU_196_0]
MMRARIAAQSLMRRGFLEPSAVAGLRTIVLARKRESARHITHLPG